MLCSSLQGLHLLPFLTFILRSSQRERYWHFSNNFAIYQIPWNFFDILYLQEFQRYHGVGPEDPDLYYLAGSYDPAGHTLNFQPGVLKSEDSE